MNEPSKRRPLDPTLCCEQRVTAPEGGEMQCPSLAWWSMRWPGAPARHRLCTPHKQKAEEIAHVLGFTLDVEAWP